MAHKKDKSRAAYGILWEAKEHEIWVVPRKRYRQWKNESLNVGQLEFQKIPTNSLSRLRLFNLPNRRKSILAGVGIGVAIGLPFGIIRQVNYDEEYCEDGGDPLWTRCIGGKNRVINNVLSFGVFGGLIGAVSGQSLAVKIKLQNGVGAYQQERDRIRRYSVIR